MKIVVDAYGNDLGPSQPVEASVKAINLYDDVNIVLCGKEEELNNLLSNYDYDKSRIEVVAADEIITNEEVPTEAVKTKSNSSLVKAFETLKQNEEVVGLVSCGSTGAVLTAAFLKLGRMKGISRPALCPVLPAKNGSKVMLIDSGANIDCKPINLCHFALLASCYAKTLFNIENPKVSLLNIGTEDKKGNEFCHECFAELKKMPINFVGNMEARDFLSGNYDIVVADGFYGNILLKSVEGTASFVLSSLKQEIKKSFLSKIGALFMKKSFKNLKSSFNYNNYGGAAFLGVKKLVVKGHGASDSLAFLKSIEQVRTLHLNKFCETMEQELISLGKRQMAEFDVKKIEKIIHYGFKNKETLKTAFTHSSYANQNNVKSNQRLEYLGDSILNFAVADYLYNNFDVEEGQMSKWRSKMVNSENLANIIETLELDKFMLLGKSFSGQELSKSVKEDLFESIVGAIYIDSSLEKAKRFIFRFINIKKSVKKKDVDYKTVLQEEVQKVKGSNLVYFTYEIPRQPGNFCAEIYINDIFVARSVNTTKKQAQIDCAKVALKDKAKLKTILKEK